jgi:hypothetical protein
MLYQLPDGRTIEMSVHDYLEFSDAELASLIGYGHIGDMINNPQYGSVITKSIKSDPDDIIDITEQDINEIPSNLKRNDQDYESEIE